MATAVIDVQQGSLQDLRGDQVAVSADYAGQHRLALGDDVTVEYPNGVTDHPAAAAIYDNDDVIASGGIALPRDAFLSHASRPADLNMLITLAEGVTVTEGEAAVQQVADQFGASM